jgi:alpha-1,6-mannosyltransferase
VTAVSSPPPAATQSRTPARSGGRARFELPSFATGGVFTLFMVAIATRLPWADDLMLHMAVLRRLIENPLHPGSPVLDQGGSSIYYSPYMLALALPAKAFGLSAYTMYKFAAVVNVLVLQYGLYRFVRTLSPARWAPPLALVGVLLWWGTSDFAWSGFLSLVSLSDTEAYPSTLATGLMLLLWAWLNDRRGRGLLNPVRTAGLGALLGLILLIHQFTGISAVVGTLAILLARRREVASRVGAWSLGAGVAACGLVIVIWPYYHLWSVSQGNLDLLDPVHRPLYDHAAAWYLMGAVLGLVALALRVRRRGWDDVLVLMFAGSGLIVLYGWLSGHYSYGRSWPMLMLTGQLAVAVAVAELGPGRPRWAWGLPVAAVTAVGLLSQVSAFVYLLPHSTQDGVTKALDDYSPLGVRETVDDLPHLDWLDGYLKPADVVAADDDFSRFEIAAHGAYNVTTPWYLPELSKAEYKSRKNVSWTMFGKDTPAAEVLALVERYRVDWILLSGTEKLPNGVTAPLVAQGEGYRLYRVTQ